MILIDCTTRRPSTPNHPVEADDKSVTSEASGKPTTESSIHFQNGDLRKSESSKEEFPTARLSIPPPHHGRDFPASIDRMQIPVPKKRSEPVHKLIIDRRSEGDQGNLEENILKIYQAELLGQQQETAGTQQGDKPFSQPEIANLYRQVVRQIETWRKRPITKIFRYVFLAGIELTCDGGTVIKRASILTAVGVDENGIREVLGVTEGATDSDTAWHDFLQQLKRQGLFGVLLFIGDRKEGLAERLSAIFPGAQFQNNFVQFRHEILSQLPLGSQLEAAKRLDRIFSSTDWSTASKLIADMTATLARLDLIPAADFFERRIWESMNHLAFPRQHRRLLRSNCAQAELRSIGARTEIVRAFSDGHSAVHWVSAQLRHIESKDWNGRC